MCVSESRQPNGRIHFDGSFAVWGSPRHDRNGNPGHIEHGDAAIDNFTITGDWSSNHRREELSTNRLSKEGNTPEAKNLMY
jgi:hypothetical protein